MIGLCCVDVNSSVRYEKMRLINFAGIGVSTYTYQTSSGFAGIFSSERYTRVPESGSDNPELSIQNKPFRGMMPELRAIDAVCLKWKFDFPGVFANFVAWNLIFYLSRLSASERFCTVEWSFELNAHFLLSRFAFDKIAQIKIKDDSTACDGFSDLSRKRLKWSIGFVYFRTI
ncbi:hypothetical protein TcasGA2_TC011719 [Tribolium castaneum]|uniref:Uncharacterized protein n=1 Tax=Tribolium castaneum TaxID=7070 RepID=D6X0B6_TRICA|nr:hypothetical protein TcasGA2_TC011719 [Tribolium castaneum]